MFADGYRELDEIELAEQYPKAYRYLKGRKAELVKRKQFKRWHGFAPRNLDVHRHARAHGAPLGQHRDVLFAAELDEAVLSHGKRRFHHCRF